MRKDMSGREVDVVVVGGGMVGAACALALGQSGWRVALIEAQAPTMPTRDEPYDLRVSALSPASVAFLDQLGVWDRMLETGRVAPYRRMRVWDQAGPGDVTFDCAEIGLPVLGHILENRLIQAALWTGIAQQDTVDCHVGVRPVVLEASPGFVDVTLDDGAQLRAQLVIGADGAASWVRRRAGIGDTGRDYDTAAQVLSVETAYPQQDITWQRFTPHGPQAFLPLAGPHASLVWYDSVDAVRARHKLDDAALHATLIDHFPTELGEIKRIEGRSFFPIRRMHAHRYVGERVVLVGDAAHTIHPLAGQGVNLGFLDAMALLETLDGVDDLGRARVLRRYERARRADNLATQSTMDVFHYGFRPTDPLLVGGRNLALSAVSRVAPIRQIAMQAASGQLGRIGPVRRSVQTKDG